MRAALLANVIVLGACGRGDPNGGRPVLPARVRDSVARAGTQGVPPARTADTPQDTRTAAFPDPVPTVAAVRAPGAAGEVAPQMRNTRLPFRYPAVLYPRHVEGNVTLRLWVDSAGRVRPESTRVAESSGARLLDSAAVAGSVRLEFTPARHDGHPVAAPLLFPVHFRHPALRHSAATTPAPAAGPGVAGRHR